jgi:hypothetical protein
MGIDVGRQPPISMGRLGGGPREPRPAAHHRGLLRFFVNDENMMLKLTLILSSSLAFASTECCR